MTRLRFCVWVVITVPLRHTYVSREVTIELLDDSRGFARCLVCRGSRPYRTVPRISTVPHRTCAALVSRSASSGSRQLSVRSTRRIAHDRPDQMDDIGSVQS